MKDLVVIAEKEELKLVEKLGFHIGYPVLITGVGALNVIEALKDIPKDTRIINIGYAGSKNLKPKTFYEVDYVTLYHPNVNYFETSYCLKKMTPYTSSPISQFDQKTCYTGCDFVLDTKLENCLFDMELAYIAALGFNNIVAYKYVSDNLDLQQYREEAKDEN